MSMSQERIPGRLFRGTRWVGRLCCTPLVGFLRLWARTSSSGSFTGVWHLQRASMCPSCGTRVPETRLLDHGRCWFEGDLGVLIVSRVRRRRIVLLSVFFGINKYMLRWSMEIGWKKSLARSGLDPSLVQLMEISFCQRIMHGVYVPACTPHYQKFNAQILILGVLTGFSAWPHARGNHLVDHGVPYARLVWRIPVPSSVISTRDCCFTFEKSRKKETPSIGYLDKLFIIIDWRIDGLPIHSQGGWGKFLLP